MKTYLLKMRSKIVSSLLVQLFLSACTLSVFGGAEMVAGAVDPLKPQFSITLPDYSTPTGYKMPDPPASVQWSPDNRYLAVVGFNSGKVFLIDVEHRQVI